MIFKNENLPQSGLAYNTEKLEDLVGKDTDLDGVLDWEEGLWGTDPYNKETTAGTPDSIAINKLKMEQGLTLSEGGEEVTETLTETEKFSRELFSTIASLSQSGTLDQTTVDEMSASLAEQLKSSPVEKVFLLSDLKITKNNTIESVRSYDNALTALFQQAPSGRTAIDILQEFITDEENVDGAVLAELAPIITATKSKITAMLNMSVPQALAQPHLDVTNGLERMMENLDKMRFFNEDTILALGAISQYQENTELLYVSVQNLANAIAKILSN